MVFFPNCDVETLCEAPCTIRNNSARLQREAWLSFLQQVRLFQDSEATVDPTTILEENPCLNCVSVGQAKVKQAEVIENGLLVDPRADFHCLSDQQIEASILYLTCSVINNLLVLT